MIRYTNAQVWFASSVLNFRRFLKLSLKRCTFATSEPRLLFVDAAILQILFCSSLAFAQFHILVYELYTTREDHLICGVRGLDAAYRTWRVELDIAQAIVNTLLVRNIFRSQSHQLIHSSFCTVRWYGSLAIR
jgi:hypothetical protein